MDVLPNSYLPGDPMLIEKVVYELKSQGIFDQFRKECIADVDTKPAYQNLRQRVEGSVSGFLRKLTWKPDMNKNQVRENLRKNIQESGFLETGVERIVDQVVNPKITSIFQNKVTEVVFKYLGIEQPSLDDSNSKEIPLKIETDNLLPTDLEQVSPCSAASTKKTDKDNVSLNDSKIDEDESPPFEPLEQSSSNNLDENSVDSHMSGFSGNGLQSHDSSNTQVPKPAEMDDTKMSYDGHLSIVMSDDNDSKMEICEDSMSKSFDYNVKHFTFNPDSSDKSSSSSNTEKKDKPVEQDEKKSKEKEDKRDKDKKDKKEKDKPSCKDVKDEKKDSKHEKKDQKDFKRDDSRDKIDNKEKDCKDKERNDSKDKDRSRQRTKSEDSKYRSRSDSHKEKDRKDERKSDKYKSSSSKDSKDNDKDSKDSKDRKDSKSNSKSSDKDRRSSSKHSSNSNRDKSSSSSSSKKESSSKDKSNDRSKSSSSSSNKDIDKNKGDYKSSSKSSSNNSASKKDDKRSSSSSSKKDSKDKKDSKPKKDEVKDDHFSQRDKRSDRRSTDRDSNDGNSTNHSSNSNSESTNSSQQQQSSKSQEDSNSGCTDSSGGNSENTEKIVDEIHLPIQQIRWIKPKIATNIHEARKLMKIRKKLQKLEKQHLIAYADQINDESHKENKHKNIITSPIEPAVPKKEIIASTSPESLSTSVVSAATWDEMEAKLQQTLNMEACNEDYEESESASVVEDNNCRYLIDLTEERLRYTEVVNGILDRYSNDIKAWEREIEMNPPKTEVVTTTSPESKVRASKRKLSLEYTTDVHNNNKRSSIIEESPFPLPLSPAESEKSIDIKIRKTTNVVKASSQRYSSDDLYKPRPAFGGSSRRRGKALAE